MNLKCICRGNARLLCLSAIRENQSCYSIKESVWNPLVGSPFPVTFTMHDNYADKIELHALGGSERLQWEFRVYISQMWARSRKSP